MGSRLKWDLDLIKWFSLDLFQSLGHLVLKDSQSKFYQPLTLCAFFCKDFKYPFTAPNCFCWDFFLTIDQYTHMLHVGNIMTFIYVHHKFMVNVGKYTIHGSYGGGSSARCFVDKQLGALMINSSWENRPTAPVYKDLGDPLCNLYKINRNALVLGYFLRPPYCIRKLTITCSWKTHVDHILSHHGHGASALSLNKTSLVYSIPDISGGVLDLGHLTGRSTISRTQGVDPWKDTRHPKDKGSVFFSVCH